MYNCVCVGVVGWGVGCVRALACVCVCVCVNVARVSSQVVPVHMCECMRLCTCPAKSNADHHCCFTADCIDTTSDSCDSHGPTQAGTVTGAATGSTGAAGSADAGTEAGLRGGGGGAVRIRNVPWQRLLSYPSSQDPLFMCFVFFQKLLRC